MTKYAIFDANGLPTAFYDPIVHGRTWKQESETGPYVVDRESMIPPMAIEITDEQHHDFMTGMGLRRWNGETIVDYAPGATADDVNSERTRRIIAGKVIDGVRVTGRDEDRNNLEYLAGRASRRISAGDETAITFRDGNNIDHQLTPAQIISISDQAGDYVSALYAASWALKALDPIPVDYAADLHWPPATP